MNYVLSKDIVDRTSIVTVSMLTWLISRTQGWKSWKNSAFPTEKYRKNLPFHHYFYLFPTVPDIRTSGNMQNFSLSFGKVPKIFTCPALILPVPDRLTVSNFHPWNMTLTIIVDMLFDHFYFKNTTEFCQGFQVIDMNNQRSEHIV